MTSQEIIDSLQKQQNATDINNSSGGMAAETLEWDAFDSLQQSRFSRAPNPKAAAQASKQQPEIDSDDSDFGSKAVNARKKGAAGGAAAAAGRGTVAARGAKPEIELDSDDSDFGEQIRAQKRDAAVQAKQQRQAFRKAEAEVLAYTTRQKTQYSTLPPGLTVLDLESSDEELYTKPPAKTGGNRVSRATQSKMSTAATPNKTTGGTSNSSKTASTNSTTSAAPTPQGKSQGIKRQLVVSMTLKDTNLTPLSMSLINDPLNQGVFGRMENGFGFDLIEEEKSSSDDGEPFEDDDDDDDEQDVQVQQQNHRGGGAAPAAPDDDDDEAPPPPPDDDDIPAPPPPTTIQQPTKPAGRMSLWERAKVDKQEAAAAAAAAAAATVATASSSTTTTSTQPTGVIPTAAAATTTASSTVISTAKSACSSTNTASSTGAGATDTLVFTYEDSVPIPKKSSLNNDGASLLTQELNQFGVLEQLHRSKQYENKQNMRNPAASAPLLLRFSFHTDPLTILVTPNMTVQEVIQVSLDTYDAQGKQPILKSDDAGFYSLCIWDDDEQEVDQDMPPFNRDQVISRIDTSSLVIVPSKQPQSTKIQQSLRKPTTVFAGTPRHMHSDSADFDLTNQQNISILAEEETDAQADMFQFDNALVSLEITEDTLTSLDTVEKYVHTLYIHMTHETAGKPVEYRVFKINEKGKRQERYFGLDRLNIYNKNTPTSKFNTFSKLMNISKTTRPINSILHVRIAPENLRIFQIAFKEADSDSFTTRGYEVDSVMVCAEIVAKIRFLINNP